MQMVKTEPEPASSAPVAWTICFCPLCDEALDNAPLLVMSHLTDHHRCQDVQFLMEVLKNHFSALPT